ncbi:translation elongation factor 4 [Spirilliplanes yamanashiensis]|uniref:Elongation factor 4 n=1 Tax=Spirilliplanes yamanashiensis TaxID=42233 RepID=A0A8J4DL54_9ACTN|nr:translation elongation factor 4 [Spirilliplanes yamanashiensis]MDP9816500.1 GTP-binding protein LepA [Spirilliplanes yamanashiensis]GIJ06027.1 elongation factor 4 [Spirilliplanes yamanashiensis]
MPATPASANAPGSTDPGRIRNFCIIAHIDHGKSTLADRMLQLTGVVDARQMRAQYLDRMDIERERGITIKSQAVRMPWVVRDGDGAGESAVLNMIDTPGHVDFTYEVSRSLAACEGAVLLVDAAQGIEAQTLANLYLAMENNLHVIPVLNKIDLPAAQPEKYAAELASLIGCDPGDVLKVSGKTGEGVPHLLDEIVRQFAPPVGEADAPARAMIFDSVYDVYRGVVTYVRVIDGKITARDRIKMMSTGAVHELLEIGVVSPEMEKSAALSVGEVGYLITGVKDVRQSRVGDTVTGNSRPATTPLGGYADPKPMVYSGLYPIDGSDYPALRDALDKLQLNDASLTYEPETSAALGFGFRCGFLGLLHLEIIGERLEREFGLDLISTAPNVVYRVRTEDGSETIVTNPSEFPNGKIAEIQEPVVKATVLTPNDYVGAVMELCQSRRGQLLGMEYLSTERVELRYTLPLAEIIFDFFDQLKSRTKGYASLDYEPSGEQANELVKVDILLHGEPVDAFSAIVHKDKAYAYGTSIAAKLQKLIPRQQFEVPIQAAIGSRIIARETIRAIRKDVLAKCYGGDISRKRKLLEKQKEGKKRMKMVGRVEVPQEAFIAALSTSDSADTKGAAKK